jgi:CRP/FNR family transcriptional regulator
MSSDASRFIAELDSPIITRPPSSVRLPSLLAIGERSSATPIELRPQQRLPLSVAATGEVLVIRDGQVSIDVIPAPDQRSILDFLMPGDLVPHLVWPLPRAVSFRAISRTTLLRIENSSVPSDYRGDFGDLQIVQIQRQLARLGVNQMIIGQLDAETRVASFLLVLAMRSSGRVTDGQFLALPMCRDDIANHLSINRDTLSRIMMRFETRGLIERMNRHMICIVDAKKLSSLTPMAPLLVSIFNAAE